ncbi:P-loop NTPase fold protein [Variovorax sp. J22R133]|uniref:KAP family P-loop NTPase fold protein n=1 Tax=Variovorax brevis TaxID=3053503 RepID=UPI002575A8A9|nr:P-loop NTPase fold protein [Variovorax sp. J22R133]MDM0116293.1 P-loop NTPase fold protein [Variovorax sp. J22R133]
MTRTGVLSPWSAFSIDRATTSRVAKSAGFVGRALLAALRASGKTQGMSSDLPKPIYLRGQSPDETVPFAGDQFDRKALAERITGLLTRLPDGAVLSIDAPWGDGKTWFGRNWHASLVEAGYRTGFIDCFQRDHIEDPFVMIAGELLHLPKKGAPQRRKKLVDASKKLGAALLPSAAKFAANTVGHWAIGKADLGDDIAKSIAALEESSAASLEKLVAKRLEAYEADKKSVDGFRNALRDLASEGDKPIVIFLDELDRCRPDFAVRTVERVKHFFEVPGVVFVLLMNRSQLVAAIRGIYGEQIDAEAYLAKFIQLSLTLPKQIAVETHSPDDNQKHCDATMVRYGFGRTEGNQQFARLMGMLATALRFSLRDVERAVVLYSLAQPLNASASDAAWPIALKLARPELFSRLTRGEAKAHDEAHKFLISVRETAKSLTQSLAMFEAIHWAGSNNFEQPLPEDLNKLLGQRWAVHGPKRFMSWVLGRVDLDVAR